MKTLKIFRYLDQLDGFVVTDEYRRIADELGITEWSPAVWIDRLFASRAPPRGGTSKTSKSGSRGSR